MSNRERLIECGYTEEMAADICRLYENDESGLSMFVHIIELFFDDQAGICIAISTKIHEAKMWGTAR